MMIPQKAYCSQTCRHPSGFSKLSLKLSNAEKFEGQKSRYLDRCLGKDVVWCECAKNVALCITGRL